MTIDGMEHIPGDFFQYVPVHRFVREIAERWLTVLPPVQDTVHEPVCEPHSPQKLPIFRRCLLRTVMKQSRLDHQLGKIPPVQEVGPDFSMCAAFVLQGQFLFVEITLLYGYDSIKALRLKLEEQQFADIVDQSNGRILRAEGLAVTQLVDRG